VGRAGDARSCAPARPAPTLAASCSAALHTIRSAAAYRPSKLSRPLLGAVGWAGSACCGQEEVGAATSCVFLFSGRSVSTEAVSDTDSLQILRALAEGKHPLTGEALPDESCYQSAKVLRALLAGIEALEKTAGRKNRVLPGAAGKPWDAEEDQSLVADFESGTSIADLAQMHQRTEGAIRSRLMKLGKLVP